MAQYRIVCTTQEPATAPPSHAHIVAVGTGTDPQKADQRWPVTEVVQAIDAGHVFFTVGPQSGKVAKVEKVYCHHCRRYYIRSAADAVRDNNLDSLRRCNWIS
jgi:Protein of unknown function (DUF3892)